MRHNSRRLSTTIGWGRTNSPEEASEVTQELLASETLTHVGSGSEGYIFRDAAKVYKYFHSSENPRKLYWMLLALSERIKASPQSDFFEFEVFFPHGHLVLCYDYFESSPFRGGEEEKVVRFLKGIRRLGWVMNNFKADNFRVRETGELVCIDLGRSFYPQSAVLFRQMCMRAFLTIRFPFHPRIKSFYTYTNTHDDFAIIESIGLDAEDFLRKFNLFYQKIVAKP